LPGALPIWAIVAETQHPIGLAVRLPFRSPEEFLQGYGQNLSKGGIYLRAKNLRAPGTPITLEIKLADGSRIISAIAKVSFVTGAHGTGVPGMGFKFLVLDAASRRFLETAAAVMPHARSDEPPLPKNVGEADFRPEAVEPPLPVESTLSGIVDAPPPSQANPSLPSELSGRLSVTSDESIPEAPPFEPPTVEPPRTGPIIGIDLGTTNSSAAVVLDGKPVLLKDKDGRTLIPSVVALTPRGKLTVGAPARAQMLQNPRWTASGFKRLLGRAFDAPEVQPIIRRFGWEVVPTESGDCGMKLGTRVYRLEEISALVLREVKGLAERHLGVPVNRAVITVPAWYTEKQRHSVREAGRLAGLHVERIVNEPTAAALAWGYGRKLTHRLLVYDLGGGTFDASVLELNENVYEVMSTGGDPFLGGMDFDTTIVAWLLSEFEQKHDTIFSDRVAIQRVTHAAEKAKIALSTTHEAPIKVPFVTMVSNKPVDLDVVLKRQTLVELTHALVDKTMEVCQEVLRVRGVRADEITEILLVGGQSQAPLVQERITVLFGRKPLQGVNPNEAVAMGAALLAHALEKQEGLLLVDVLPQSIGVGLPGGKFEVVVPRNTALPTTRTHRLVTTADGQESIEVPILQGSREIAKENTYLGTVKLSGLPPAPAGGVAIELSFELSNECLLTLTAKNAATGQDVTATFVTQDSPEHVRERMAALEKELPPAAAQAQQRGFGGWLSRLLGG
jgi:molecular chaperone DnaK